MFCVVIHKTYYKNSVFSRAFCQCIMVCEVENDNPISAEDIG